MIAYEQKANNNESSNWHWLKRPYRSIDLLSCSNQWIIHEFNCFIIVVVVIVVMAYLLVFQLCRFCFCSCFCFMWDSFFFLDLIVSLHVDTHTVLSHSPQLISSRAITNHSLTSTLRCNKTMQAFVGSRPLYYCTS